MNDISLLTVVSGQREHLNQTLRGVALQVLKPREMVIVFINEPVPTHLPNPGCPLYLHSFTDDHRGLPLASARNFAASCARGKLLVFLEADCIPGPHCIQQLRAGIELTHAVIMANSVDLPNSFSGDQWTYDQLDALTGTAPAVKIPTSCESLAAVPYEEFRSLCFGLRAADYARLGGYDQLYRGERPADIDFAYSARHIDLPILKCGNIYRQPAPPADAPHSPDKLKEVVENAASFYHKWQRWPMPELLHHLDREGLIRLSKNDIQLTKATKQQSPKQGNQ